MSDGIAIAVVVALAVIPFPDELFRARGLAIFVALLPVAVMPGRRRWPLAALGASLVCYLGLACAGILAPSTLIAVAITAFSVTDRMRRSIGIGCVAAATLIVFVVNAIPLGGDLFDSRAMQFVTFIVLAGALGDAAKSRRQYASAMTQRAERAERNLHEEARRRVAEERVRFARDLHDVLAHQISVISLNAGVATTSLESRPERTREALAAIRSASRTVLADIGGLMVLLRENDAHEQPQLHPPAGLNELDKLINRFAYVGLRVELRREPHIAALSPASDHVAYLALQEGLTNAHKHGSGGRAVVDFRTSDGAMLLTVTNPLPAGQAEATLSGHGLRGLRERVTAVRGHVSTSHVEGDFRLDIRVPFKMEVEQ